MYVLQDQKLQREQTQSGCVRKPMMMKTVPPISDQILVSIVLYSCPFGLPPLWLLMSENTSLSSGVE